MQSLNQMHRYVGKSLLYVGVAIAPRRLATRAILDPTGQPAYGSENVKSDHVRRPAHPGAG